MKNVFLLLSLIIIIGAGCGVPQNRNIDEVPPIVEKTSIDLISAPEEKKDLIASGLKYGVNRLDLVAFKKQNCEPQGEIGPNKVEPFGKYGGKKYIYTCGDSGWFEKAVLFVNSDDKPIFYFREGNMAGGIEFQRNEDSVSHGIVANYVKIKPCLGELGGSDGIIQIDEIALDTRVDLHSKNAKMPFTQTGCNFYPRNFTILDNTFFNASFEVEDKKFILNFRTKSPFIYEFGDSNAYHKGLD